MSEGAFKTLDFNLKDGVIPIKWNVSIFFEASPALRNLTILLNP